MRQKFQMSNADRGCQGTSERLCMCAGTELFIWEVYNKWKNILKDFTDIKKKYGDFDLFYLGNIITNIKINIIIKIYFNVFRWAITLYFPYPGFSLEYYRHRLNSSHLVQNIFQIDPWICFYFKQLSSVWSLSFVYE